MLLKGCTQYVSKYGKLSSGQRTGKASFHSCLKERRCQTIFKLPYSSVQSLSCVWLFVTPWTAASQVSLFIINSWSLLKFMFIESVMPSNRLIFCHPLLLLPSVFPSIKVLKGTKSIPDRGKRRCRGSGMRKTLLFRKWEKTQKINA